MYKSSVSLLMLMAAPLLAAAPQDHGAHHQMMDHGAHRQMISSKTYMRSVATYPMPEVTLVRQDGKRVDLQALLNGSQPVALNFIFTTCTTICPVMTATFSRMRHALGPDAAGLKMVSISIDPEYDTPSALTEYAAKFNAGPDWVFLTGSLEDVIAVQKAFDAFTGDKTNHRPLTFLRGRDAPQWVRIDGLANASELAQEYRALAHGSAMASTQHHHQ